MQLTTFCLKQLRITLLRVCAMHFIRIYLSHWVSGTQQYNTIQYNIIQYNTIQYNTIQYNTIQYNTIQYKYFLFRAEQLTKNLIQWLWIDYIDWKMTTFYETRHHLTCVVLSHTACGQKLFRFRHLPYIFHIKPFIFITFSWSHSLADFHEIFTFKNRIN